MQLNSVSRHRLPVRTLETGDRSKRKQTALKMICEKVMSVEKVQGGASPRGPGLG